MKVLSSRRLFAAVVTTVVTLLGTLSPAHAATICKLMGPNPQDSDNYSQTLYETTIAGNVDLLVNKDRTSVKNLATDPTAAAQLVSPREENLLIHISVQELGAYGITVLETKIEKGNVEYTPYVGVVGLIANNPLALSIPKKHLSIFCMNL